MGDKVALVDIGKLCADGTFGEGEQVLDIADSKQSYKIDVNGDGLMDELIVSKYNVAFCHDHKVKFRTRHSLFPAIQKGQSDVPIHVRNDGRKLKVGDSVGVAESDKVYVIVGFNYTEKSIYFSREGRSIVNRDMVYVMLYERDTYKKLMDELSELSHKLEIEVFQSTRKKEDAEKIIMAKTEALNQLIMSTAVQVPIKDLASFYYFD